MKAYPECIPCLFKQALNSVAIVSRDPAVHEEVLREVGRRLPDVSLGESPAMLSQLAYETTSRVTGVTDPYREVKEETNREALRLLPDLEKVVRCLRINLMPALKLHHILRFPRRTLRIRPRPSVGKVQEEVPVH